MVVFTLCANGYVQQTLAQENAEVGTEVDEDESVEELMLKEPPSITIGGSTISSFNPYAHFQKSDGLLPDSLKNPEFKKKLKNKIYVKAFSHSPRIGVKYAPIEIIEFMDLGCGENCMEIMQKLSKLQERHPQKVRLTHIYMPAKEGLNMVNFYGKIAAKNDVFWPYRKRILTENIAEGQKALEELLDLGVSRAAIRLAARREADAYYKELDQEKFLADKLELRNPPHLFVNGIHVGEGGIPLDKLEDVILYELMQIKKMGI